MKVYFHASLTQKPKYGEYYLRIIKHLTKLKFTVRAPHITDHEHSGMMEQDRDLKSLPGIYKLVLKRIMWADILVFEVSFPSTLVCGHILTRALERGKPVLGLFHHKTTPGILAGIEHERLVLLEYDDDNLKEVLEYGLAELAEMSDQRFTMLLPGKIVQHLNKLSETGINKSEYIRKLILKDMKS